MGAGWEYFTRRGELGAPGPDPRSRVGVWSSTRISRLRRRRPRGRDLPQHGGVRGCLSASQLRIRRSRPSLGRSCQAFSGVRTSARMSARRSARTRGLVLALVFLVLVLVPGRGRGHARQAARRRNTPGVGSPCQGSGRLRCRRDAANPGPRLVCGRCGVRRRSAGRRGGARSRLPRRFRWRPSQR